VTICACAAGDRRTPIGTTSWRLLPGVATILMEIDATLDRVVTLLEKEYGDGEDA
jgi:hypothetical protein